MDMIWKKHLTVLAIIGSLGLAACGNEGAEDPFIEKFLLQQRDYFANQSTPFSSISQKITYKMKGVKGKNVSATAVVLVPKGTAPEGGWPMVVWAHGTTGVADACAPSNTETLGGVDSVIAQLLKEGYMVVAPDYEGLGSDGIHPYLNLSSEGRSIVYALRAARQLVPSASKRWVVYGHSQGGHAALGAPEFQKESGDLKFLGAVAIAPASNLALGLQASQAAAAQAVANGDAALASGNSAAAQAFYGAAIRTIAQTTTFSAYVVAGLKETSSIQYSDVFGEQASAVLSDPVTGVEQVCNIGEQIGADITPLAATGQILSYGGIKADFASNAVVSSFLSKQTEPATVKINQPVLIIQGDADTTVPKPLTDKLVGDLMAKGTTVTYTVVTGKDHGSAFTDTLPTVLDFIKARFAAK